MKSLHSTSYGYYWQTSGCGWWCDSWPDWVARAVRSLPPAMHHILIHRLNLCLVRCRHGPLGSRKDDDSEWSHLVGGSSSEIAWLRRLCLHCLAFQERTGSGWGPWLLASCHACAQAEHQPSPFRHFYFCRKPQGCPYFCPGRRLYASLKCSLSQRRVWCETLLGVLSSCWKLPLMFSLWTI